MDRGIMSREQFDDALDDAAHAAFQAFSEALGHLSCQERLAIMESVNDTLAPLMRDYIEVMGDDD